MDNNLEQAKKKAGECQADLTYELDSYILSSFQLSASRLSGQFLATNRKAFHHQKMRQLVNKCFNKEEEGDEPTMPLSQQAAFPSQTPGLTLAEYRNSRYYRELLKKTEECKAALIQVLETYIQSCFPSSATGLRAKFFANLQSFHREQMLRLIDDYFNSEEDITSNQESAQVDTTPAMQSDSVTPSYCGSDDSMADKGRVQAESVMASPECDNPDAPPNDATEELTTAGHGSEMTNNQDINIDEAINSLLNQEKNLVDESVVQMPSEAQQPATVPTADNSNHEQVDNSVNNNFENLKESQVMYFSDDLVVDEQVIFFEEGFVDETFPAVNFVTIPSTENVNYAIVPEEDEESADEYSTVNLNRKRTIPLAAGELSTPKRVAVDPVVATDDEEEDNEEEVGVEAVAAPLKVIVHHLNCPETGCTEECKDRAQLNGHLLSKHQIREFRCKVKDCGLSFTTPNELSDHRKLAHRNLEDLPCAQCETTCKSYQKLSAHFRDYHVEGEFGCSADRCDFTAKTRQRVRNHQLRKHQPRKYVCTFANCTASFKQQSKLTVHQRKHNQERPFACEECHKAFPTKGNLTVHQRIHSGLKYHCKWLECKYSARQRGNVYIHVRKVHFGLPASKKAQDEQNIIDTRNADEFIEKNPTK